MALDAAIRAGGPEKLTRWARDRPHLATSLVVCDLFPRWVEAGSIEEAAWWPGLGRLAEAVRQDTGDRLLTDIVREMRTALAEQRGEEIAEGIRQLRQGLNFYQIPDYEHAIALLRASAHSLQRVRSLGMVARIYGAISLHSSNRIDEAAVELSRIIEEAGERSYSWPLGYAHWTLGRMASEEDHPLAALEHRRQAVQVFERIRAEDLVLSIGIMMAETYSNLGQAELTWDYARKALLAAHRLGDSGRLFFVLNVLGGIADDQGRLGFALYAQTSAIDHSAEVSASLRADAHLWRAYYLGREELYDRAQDDLRQAEALARLVTSPLESRKIEAKLDLARGSLAMHTDPEAAAVWLGDAARLFEQTGGGRLNWLVALKARAEALRKLGRVEEAADDLRRAMAVYDLTVRDLAKDKDEKGLLSEPDRLSYLLQNADVYQTMIDLHVRELRSPWMALVLAEHAKSLRAPGRPSELQLSEDSVDRWVRALPPKTALLSYSMAGENSVAWVLTPVARLPRLLGRAEEVVALIDRLDQARDAAAWKDLSSQLYSSLVGPLEEPLRGVERLLIVPSPGLDRVPFAGLFDPQSRRYLVQSYLIEMLPSAAALLREGSSRVEQRRNLVVGDPKPIKAALLGLDPLRFAEEEAQAAAFTLGPDTVLLLGSDATPSRFREQAVGAGVIHVAGHALALGRGPDSAALVLATGEGDEEGLLTAQEVLHLPLSGTRLVILSACFSAGGPAVSWQSGLTLGRSFLSAGAERVIATLHAVTDEEGAKLFEVFHHKLASGQDAAASLRNAQLEVLEWRSSAESWTPPSWPYVIILGARPSK